MAPGVSDVAEELLESSGPVMPPRLLRRSTSDFPGGVLERWLSRAMEPTSDEEVTAASACDVAGSADVVLGDSIMAPGVSAVAEELRESSGPMPSRLVRRKTSDLDDAPVEAWLTAIMDQPTSPEEVTVETACDHSVAGDVSTASVAGEPPAVVSADEVWRRFTPIVIDPVKCLARTFNGGAGGQCKRNPQTGGVTCGSCKKLAHGRVDGPIPDGKLQTFLRSSRGK